MPDRHPRLPSVLLLAILLVAAKIASAQSPEAFGKTAIDTSRSACDDFYDFATGSWLARNPIPDDLPTWGTGNVVARDARTRLRSILEEGKTSRDASERSAGNYYANCMDEAAVERQGLDPLRDELRDIESVHSPEAVGWMLARLQTIGVAAPFRVSVESDRTDSSLGIAVIGPANLGLSKNDYSAATPRAAELRKAYATYVARLLRASGQEDAEALDGAASVLALETKLAASTLSMSQRRDPQATYNVRAFAVAERSLPHLPLRGMFAMLRVAPPARINVAEPAFVRTLEGAIVAEPPAVWRAYLRFVLLDSYATTLPKAFVDASFAFHSTAKNGVVQRRPRWRECVGIVDSDLGTFLGTLYARRALGPDSRRRVDVMTRNIVAAFRGMIETSDWMSPAAKKAAQSKLANVGWQIGGPDRGDPVPQIARGPLAAAAMTVARHAIATHWAGAGKRAPAGRWMLSPAEPNAMFDQNRLTIFVTAAELQPPYFDPGADDAWNYGAIGTVIGHELTHAFDDKGAKFDAHGNLVDWWGDADRQAFAGRVACLTARLAPYEVEGQRVDASAVAGEAIADRGGVKAALAAFETSGDEASHKVIDGLTPEQRFFIAFAQMYTRHSRHAWTIESMKGDVHMPDALRVTDTIRALPAFRKAWGCDPVPPDCDVW